MTKETIEGIALKPTRDVQGTDWPEEALRGATDSAVGSPVVSSFGDDPKEIGEITDAEYRDGEGIWYQAEIDTTAINLDAVSIAPAVTFGTIGEIEDGLEPSGLKLESLAPVSEATEAVGEHEVVESDDE